MEDLTTQRKIVDPQTHRVRRRMYFDLHRLAFVEAVGAVVETKAHPARREQARDSHCVKVCQRSAKRRRYHIDLYFRTVIWEKAFRKLDDLRSRVGTWHCPGYSSGAAPRGLGPQ